MTSQVNGTLAILAEQASVMGMDAKLSTENELLLTLTLVHMDKRKLEYKLVVTASGNRLEVREQPSYRHLPVFCPERHINLDGFFCMYWEGHEEHRVTDADSARTWLKLTLEFLRLQRRAGDQRRWPTDEGWAHGDAAAHQQDAERIAKTMGESFLDDVKARRLTAKCDFNGTTRLYRGQHEFCTILKSTDHRMKGRRTSARVLAHLEGGEKRIIRESLRAKKLDMLATSLLRLSREEELYWKCFEGKNCCQTMDGCPLRVHH